MGGRVKPDAYTQRIAGSEVRGTFVVMCLQMEKAILSSFGDLFVIESYLVVGGIAFFFTGYLGNEPENMSGFLCALTGL